MRTAICDLLGIQHPIMLAGMGGVARADLVAAVSNAGGLGVVGAVSMGLEELRQEIRRTKDLTDRPFAVDVVLPASPVPKDLPADFKAPISEEHLRFLRELKARHHISVPDPDGSLGAHFTPGYFERQIEIILEEGVPHFATGLGDPAPYVEEMHRRGMKIISLCGNVKNARRLAEAGVDIVVAQGAEGGGHTGRIGTMALVPQVVDAVGDRVPVAAAGGISDGRGLAAALALGAAGAWIGTRFLATAESPIPDGYKQRILEMTEEDTRVTRCYSGKTMRVIKNAWVEEWERAELSPLPMPFQSMLVFSTIIEARARNNCDVMSMPAGQIGGAIQEIKPAQRVVEEIVAEGQAVLQALPR